MKNSRMFAVFAAILTTASWSTTGFSQDASTPLSALGLTDEQSEELPAWINDRLDPPPGPIQATMKPLSEIEPRDSVNNLIGNADWTHIITEPGSYYLTSNVHGEPNKGGILIEAQPVTLNLNGFSVVGSDEQSEDRNGIQAGDHARITNGIIENWTGIGLRGNDNIIAMDVSIINVSISNPETGFSRAGIWLRNQAHVERCRSVNITENGILVGSESTIKDCFVSDAYFGIFAGNLGDLGPYQITGTIASECDTGFTVSQARIKDCIATECSIGFRGGNGSALTDCTSFFSSDLGFNIQGDSRLSGCLSFVDSGTGFFIEGRITLDNCHAWRTRANGSGFANGFIIQGDASLNGCTATLSAGSGFTLMLAVAGLYNDGATLTGCRALQNTAVGFAAVPYSTFIDCVSKDNEGFQFLGGSDFVRLERCRFAVTEPHASTSQRVLISSGIGTVIQDCVFDIPFQWGQLARRGTIRGNYFNSDVSMADPLSHNTLVVQNFFRNGPASAPNIPMVLDPEQAGPWSNLANIDPNE